MTTDVFTPSKDGDDNANDIKSYREELLKKFKDDEAIAKGKWEADKTIAQREQELAELRKELNTRISLEEFMTKQFENGNSNNSVQPNVEIPNQPDTRNDIDIEKIVNDAINKHNVQTQRARNVEISQQKMREVWGSSASERLNEQANKLGLGKEFLQDLAERSPEAFLQVVGATKVEKKIDTSTPPRTHSNSASNIKNIEGVRNEEHWDNIRRNDPKFYFSAEGYNQRHKDALTLGEDYFNI